MNTKQCQGWRRHGGAFTIGPVKWEQCKNDGIVMLTVTQDGSTKTMPACKECWKECIATGIEITKVTPL